MKISAKKALKEFRLFWKHYILQSTFATCVIFIVILSLSIEKEPVIIASIGATTFIVFAMPKNITAKPRNIIGGHLVGLSCGFLFSCIPHDHVNLDVISSFIYASSVGLSILIMVTIDVEHPPASGTALGASITGFSWNVTITVMCSIIILALIHRLFEKYLKDLT